MKKLDFIKDFRPSRKKKEKKNKEKKKDDKDNTDKKGKKTLNKILENYWSDKLNK